MKIDYTQNPEHLRWASARIGDSFDPRLSSWMTQLSDSGDVEAVTIFTGWSDYNVFMSCAADKPGAKRYIKEVFRYAFETLGALRVTLMSRHTNSQAIQMHKRLGATYEGTLHCFYGADHAIVSRILKPACKWIGANHVQPIQDTQSA